MIVFPIMPWMYQNLNTPIWRLSYPAYLSTYNQPNKNLLDHPIWKLATNQTRIWLMQSVQPNELIHVGASFYDSILNPWMALSHPTLPLQPIRPYTLRSCAITFLADHARSFELVTIHCNSHFIVISAPRLTLLFVSSSLALCRTRSW